MKTPEVKTVGKLIASTSLIGTMTLGLALAPIAAAASANPAVVQAEQPTANIEELDFPVNYDFEDFDFDADWDETDDYIDELIEAGVITEADLDTLSMEEVDRKLKAAGKETIFDSQDPLYKMTEAEIEKLTDEEWEKIEEKYVELYGEDFFDDEDDWDEEDEYIDELIEAGVITEEDFDKLSMEQIDAKLKAAGKETIFDAQDPLYKMTEAEIEKLTDEEWEKIEEKYVKLYGEDFFDDEDDWDGEWEECEYHEEEHREREEEEEL